MRADRLLRMILVAVPAMFPAAGAAWAQARTQPAGGGKAARARMGTLADKTLVAWVYPANLTQRGGSALTLIDSAERFDAIVLGEVAPGKWMAGSDFFHRTQRDQSAWPRAEAEARTCVQIAIVYKGSRISIFRDGRPYAAYAIARPQPFGRNTLVLIGLRYIGAMGPIGFFAGGVEEARIYDVALGAEAIAALKPNQPSSPKPIGQWTFEGGTTADAAGNFPEGRLCGGARIAGGKLLLNGKDAYMISESLARENPRMFYRPRSKQTGRMWDTWLYLRDGKYYLYYLAKRGRRWDNISMATSPDGVHWTEHGRILSMAAGVTWMGTGSTWRSPNFQKDGKFFMNFSEWRGPRQTILFAESTDLRHWKRLGDEYEFKQDTRWYKPNGRWDCIYTIRRPGGGLYGYWTATPTEASGGRFGFGESLDGVRWRALAPPKTPGVGGGEVGAVEKIGRLGGIILSRGHESEQMQGIGVLGIDGENAAAQSPRVDQPVLLEKSYRLPPERRDLGKSQRQSAVSMQSRSSNGLRMGRTVRATMPMKVRKASSPGRNSPRSPIDPRAVLNSRCSRQKAMAIRADSWCHFAQSRGHRSSHAVSMLKLTGIPKRTLSR